MQLVTLQTIADRTGLSRSAVSLAMRNHPRVAATTRERVQKVAQELGYRPNALVTAHMAYLRLRQQPSYRATLGVVHVQPPEAEQDSPSHSYLAGVRARAEQVGFGVAEFSLSKELRTKRLVQILQSRGIGGIVIPPLAEAGESIEFAWSEFASVTLGYSLASPKLHRACADVFSAVGVLLEELEQRNYKRPGFALFEDTDVRVQHLALGRFLAWQETMGRRRRVPVLRMSGSGEQSRFLHWMDRHEPDVIISPSAEVMNWIRAARADIPRDVGFASTSLSPKNPDGISGIRHNYEHAGAAAVDLLVGQLHRNERGIPIEPKLTLMPSRWIEGTTLRSKNG